MSTKPQIVLLTGATAGIGRTTALYLAGQGHHVIATGRRVAQLEALRAEAAAKQLPGRLDVTPLDVTSLESIDRAVVEVNRLTAGYGVDVLVNNAGFDQFAFFLDTDPAFWEKVIAINLKGPINLHHACLTIMAEQKSGRVINIASDAGRVGSSGESVYSACKGGIIAFTKTMAREMARSGVLVNCV
ncbi:MAG: SDR family oxidoreductase, partial [Myxococcales bacterium]|nr:SDR family oxidoreductase [Myxococcales bacterium]